MSAYRLFRNLLFLLPPEAAHKFALQGLDSPLGLCFQQAPPDLPQQCLGLKFRHPLGLAAGLDKNAEHLAAWFRLGFSFVEVGTVTPKPQPGNPGPRLFRLSEQQALINRLGFNNRGIEYLCRRVQTYRVENPDAIIGINIGKNADTPVAQALADYVTCLRAAYPLASYIAVNLSSPNTPGLRALQHGQSLQDLVSGLQQEQAVLAKKYARSVPLVFKIAPDLNDAEIKAIADCCNRFHVDAVIAGNTSLSRQGVEQHPLHKQAGGLSGAPIFARATQVVRELHKHLNPDIPIIGVGGILSARDAVQKYHAGAKLLQIYTGFIYQGPKLITEIVEALSRV